MELTKKIFMWIGIVLAVIVACVAIFFAITAIFASGNGVSIYEQWRLWFGSASNFAQLFK